MEYVKKKVNKTIGQKTKNKEKSTGVSYAVVNAV